MSWEKLNLQEQPETTIFDVQLALQCAPLILGLRISLFLTVTDQQLKRIENILRDRKISLYKICEHYGKMAVLLFYEEKLEEYFAEETVWNLLSRLGYSGGSFYDFMDFFAERYKKFLKNEIPFPHEMGIFLGYPTEDVMGYLENAGDNYLCAGDWKVYKNVQEKRRLFSQFDRARDVLVSLILQGNSLVEAVEIAAL